LAILPTKSRGRFMVGVGAGADVVGSAVVAATVAEVAARDAILKTHTQ